MFPTIRDRRMATTAKSVGAALIATVIGAGTAAADDAWEVTVKNDGKLPLKVVILNKDFGEVGRTSDFITDTVTLKLDPKKKSAYHWEAFARGDPVPCATQQNVSTSSITVHCDHTKAEERNPVIAGDTKITVPAKLRNTGSMTFAVVVKDHETGKWVFNGDLKSGEARDISITAVKAPSVFGGKQDFYTVIDWEALGLQDGKRVRCGSGQITINSEAIPKGSRTIEVSCKK
jgi:hypothetical protein